MIIRKRPARQGDKPATTLNLLWRHDQRPIYIMDNHLAALWCWLRELDRSETYTLVHVDAHWDLADPFLRIEHLELLDSSERIEEFEAIPDPHPRAGPSCPAIRWDNFIAPLLKLRKGLKRGLFLVTQPLYPNAVRDERFRTCSEWRLLRVFGRGLSGRILMNIDVDYFFSSEDGYRQRVSSAKAREFLSSVLGYLRPQDIVTIALSPQCCGGMTKALHICDLICECLGIEMPDCLENG